MLCDVERGVEEIDERREAGMSVLGGRVVRHRDGQLAGEHLRLQSSRCAPSRCAGIFDSSAGLSTSVTTWLRFAELDDAAA